MPSNPRTKRQKTPPKRKPDDTPSPPDTSKKRARRTKTKNLTLDSNDIQEVARSKEAQGLKIEDELHRTFLGSFRMSASSLDFEWQGSDTTDQRRVSSEHVKKMLTHFYTGGLKRCAKEHHISAIIRRDMFEEAVQSTIRATGIDPMNVKINDDPPPEQAANVSAPRADSQGMTENDHIYQAKIRYPYLVLPAGVTVEAQSGQHRIHALRLLFTEERDKWWVIDLYDDSIDKAAKEKLRLNVLELHKPPTLAEIWANLLVYQQENDQSATDATLATIRSPTKVRQLLFFEQYRNAITQALRNRGVWKFFTSGRFSLFLPMRCVEENVRYLTRAAKIWDYIGEGIPGFHESIDDITLRQVEGLAPARFIEDTQAVEEGMEGKWFYKIADKDHRALIKSRIKSIDYRILSLNTFWEDIRSMSYFSRVMADVAFWLSEDFSAAVRTGTAGDHSLATTFQVEGFKPELVYNKSDYPQLMIRDNKLVPLTGARLPDSVYSACAYTQVWLFVIRNFFSLHKALNPKPNDSGVQPLPWVVGGPSFSDDMSEQQIEVYNNRFCIPEWKKLWEFSRALGFHPTYADDIGINPKFCKLPPIPGQDPQAMSELNDMTRLSATLQTIRPALSKAEITRLCGAVVEMLPQLAEDELGAFGEVCPRTESVIRRFGSLDSVWLPEFHEHHSKIDDSVMKSTAQVPIELDADETAMSWFVKRDFIWSFLRPSKTADPIFAPRKGSWPPPPAARTGLKTANLCDDELLGAYMNNRELMSPPAPSGGDGGGASMDDAGVAEGGSSSQLSNILPQAKSKPAPIPPGSSTVSNTPRDGSVLPGEAPLRRSSPSRAEAFEGPPSLSLESDTRAPSTRASSTRASSTRAPSIRKQFSDRETPRKSKHTDLDTRRQKAVKQIKTPSRQRPTDALGASSQQTGEDEDGEMCE